MELTRWNGNSIYDPFEGLKRLQDEINDLFETDRPGSAGLFDHRFSPSVDVVEDKENFTILCEAPGMDEKNLDLNISSNVLTIKGTKESSTGQKEKGKSFRREIWTGSFQRTLPLPSSVDSEKISAVLKDGILRIVLPKKEEAKPKRISVDIK